MVGLVAIGVLAHVSKLTNMGGVTHIGKLVLVAAKGNMGGVGLLVS